MDKFWCCFVQGTGGFSRHHETEEDARIEAESLSRKDWTTHTLET